MYGFTHTGLVQQQAIFLDNSLSLLQTLAFKASSLESHSSSKWSFQWQKQENVWAVIVTITLAT